MGTRTRLLSSAVVASVLVAACGSSGDSAGSITAAETTATTTASSSPSTTDNVSTTESPGSTDDATSTTDAEAATYPELNRGSALDSVDSFIESWAGVVQIFPDVADLAPTISSADVDVDPTSEVDVFVEQASPGTVIGGIVDPESGVVTGLMGLSDPDSDEAFVMIEIIWVGAFGIDHLEDLEELFSPDDLRALEIGDQMTRIHEGKSIVLNYVDGANPDDGLLVFTVGDEALLEDDPAHDSITNVVIGLLVRTS